MADPKGALPPRYANCADRPAGENCVRPRGHEGHHVARYMEWGYAGGPEECSHGYANGIPCPRCDWAPGSGPPAPAMHLPAQMDALRTELEVEVERLRNLAISGGATPGDLRTEADRLAFIVRQFVPVQHDDQVGGVPVERAP